MTEINTRCEFLCRECDKALVSVAMGLCDACLDSRRGALPEGRSEIHPAVELLRLLDQASIVFEHRFAEAPIMMPDTLVALRTAFQILRNFTSPLVWAASDAAASRAKERVAAVRAEIAAKREADGLSPTAAELIQYVEELTDIDPAIVQLIRNVLERHAERREKTCDPT